MSKKDFFSPVNPKVDFVQMEKRILRWWYEKAIVDKYLAKNASSGKNFSFLDGPITANNPMGVHHAWGRTYKDLWQRYNNMKGFKQRFQNGFDCQGLWVEVEVEKELGLRNKRDIENLVPGKKRESIAKFVNLCKERVFKYAKVQTEQSKRLGYFMDWDNSYYTLSDQNNFMIWRFLKQCYERDLIYKGRDSVPWCPRCGTAISQHEMLTEDYKEVTHESVYIEYPIKGRKNEYLLVWTTTPWTLPGNVAVAVDVNQKYALTEGEVKGNKYYVLESVAQELNLKVVKKVKGKELVGFEYSSPFDSLPRVKKSLGGYTHKVIETDEKILPISSEEGTGLVHMAPGAGAEDFQLAQKLGLPLIELIDESAFYIDGLGKFSGKNAKKHPELIFDFLRTEKDGLYLFDVVKVTHRYPACWRCKSELVWRVVDEWYISIDPVREDMKSVAKKINWIPQFGLKRELDWLKNMHDWLISKKRYWGLALPIWECQKCGNFEVIGSKEELKKRAKKGWSEFEGHTPHRPWIDEVEIECSKCGSRSRRIEDVGNPWLDAGIVPFSTISPDNKAANPNYQDEKPAYEKSIAQWKEWFPADFITESFPGQFKNWFYSLIAMSTVLENKEPFKNVLGFATLLDEKGKPMHKSAGNSIEFNDGADKIGVDVMRWMYLGQNPSENLLFGYSVANETRRRFHLKLWNVYNFFVTYANVDGWRPVKGLTRTPTSDNILDRWLVSRLNQTIHQVNGDLRSFNAFSAVLVVEEFVDDLSNWYVRRSRERVGLSAQGGSDKNSFYSTSYWALVRLCRLLAPFIPFISEEIYRNLTKEESVHLDAWPQEGDVDIDLISDMELARRVAESAHALRKEKGIPVRQPLLSLVTVTPRIPKYDISLLVKDELNVKEWKVSKGKFANKLDIRITPELEEEAKVRDLVRRIQEERKAQGFPITAQIDVESEWLPRDKELLKRIKQKALIKNIRLGKHMKVLKS